MKKPLFLLTLIFFAAASKPSLAQSGQEVMEKFLNHFKAADETTKATMTLINKQGKERSRSLEIMTKRYPNDLHKTLIRFASPQSIYGTGLLIVENLERSDDQWLYLPVLKKVKKISSAERSHSFMDSEFAYEDLQGEVAKDFNYKLLRSEVVNGQDCFVIEATPASSRKLAETGFGKRLLWIRKDIFFKVKVEYYDKEGRLLKTEADEELVRIDGGKYRMNKIIMVNNRTGNKTIMSSSARTIGSGISDSKFTVTYLEQGTI